MTCRKFAPKARATPVRTMRRPQSSRAMSASRSRRMDVPVEKSPVKRTMTVSLHFSYIPAMSRHNESATDCIGKRRPWGPRALVRTPVAVAESGVVADAIERGIGIAEFLANSRDEGADIGAKTLVAMAGRKVLAVNEIVDLAI